MTRIAIAIFTGILLTACAPAVQTTAPAPAEPPGVKAQVAQAKQNLAQFKRDDLQAAIAAAGKATDPGAPYRARCYVTLLAHVPDGLTVGQAIPAITGVVSGYEFAAELDAKVRAGGGQSLIPVDVHANCAYVTQSIAEFIVRIDALAAGAALGAPGIGSGISGAAGALPGILNALPKP